MGLARVAIKEFNQGATFTSSRIHCEKTGRHWESKQAPDLVCDELRPHLPGSPSVRRFEQVWVSGDQERSRRIVRYEDHLLRFGAARENPEALVAPPTGDINSS